MTTELKILAISGSTRKSSSNLNLIKAIATLTTGAFKIHVFEKLMDIPHFNPDLDNEDPPEKVVDLKKQLKEADGILICTPEYAIGVPGTLKNAVDWTVSSMEFSQKPVALITASTSGTTAHKALLGTLLIIESKITADTQLVISSVRTKVNAEGEITDKETLNQVSKLMRSFAGVITGTITHGFLKASI